MSTSYRPTYPPAPGEDDTFQPAFFPSTAAPVARRAKRPPAYLWFTAGFSVKIAVNIFREKYNCTPARIAVEGAHLKVGPIPEEMTA